MHININCGKVKETAAHCYQIKLSQIRLIFDGEMEGQRYSDEEIRYIFTVL